MWVAAAAGLFLAGCSPGPSPARSRSVPPSPPPAASPARTASSRYPVAVPPEAALPRHMRASRWLPAPGRPWAHRLLLAGAFTDVVSAGNVLYVLETLPRRAEPMQLLVRADLRTRIVRYAHQLVPVAGAGTVVSRSGVWLLGSAWLSRDVERFGPLTLYRFDPRTLRLISRRTVGPGGCCQQATLTGWAGGRLWLTVGSAVRLIRPVPWTVLHTIRIRAGQVQSLSFSDDRRRVYLALARDEKSGGLLQERTLPGWQLMHAGTVSSDLNIGRLSAAGAALWVTAGGGMTSQIQLFTADLSHVRLALGAGELARGPEEKHFFSFENNVRAAVLAGVTWLTSSNALACLQPDTGRVLAEQPGDQTRGPIITMDPAAVRGDIYGLGAHGLMQLQPPAACHR
jgi:hypothetical protein